MSAFLPDIDSLSLHAQVAQMIVVRASGYLFDHQIRYPQWEPPAKVLHDWLGRLGVGGVILLGGSAAEIALRTQQLQEWAKIPLLMAADVEEGVGQRFSGATWFPPPMALAAIAHKNLEQACLYAEQFGAITAQEARAIGLNWVLAPTVDVNNNRLNPVINIRAFGETPDIVTQLTIAFIQGAKRHPVITVAKHFPGHGDTAVDSHLELPVLAHSLERLETVELPPFKAAIAAGVDSVMSAHLQIPALDSMYPATLSDRILTRELRQRLGFQGLIVTDALIMGAIADRYGANEAAVLAVEAGADILLMPADPAGAIQAICHAVADGRIPADRIQASVERIWHAKRHVCSPNLAGETSHAWESITPEIAPDHLTSRLSQPTAIALVDTLLQESMTVHLPESFQPVVQTQARNLILIDDALNCKELGTYTPAIALPAAQGYRLQLMDGRMSNQVPLMGEERLPTLFQLFIRGNPFKSSANLTQIAKDWLTFLVDSQQLQAVIIYGSPYVLDTFLPILPPHIPYVLTYGQMPQAQAIALRTLFPSP